MQWFKTRFQERVRPAFVGTPLTIDLITASLTKNNLIHLVCKKGQSEKEILRLCVAARSIRGRSPVGAIYEIHRSGWRSGNRQGI